MSYKRNNQKGTNVLNPKTISIFSGIIILCIILFVVINNLDTKDKTLEKASEKETKKKSDVVIINGKEYVPKKDIETYLFIGVDSLDKVHKVEEYDGTGQCDVLTLLVRDLGQGTFRTLSIDRNTMANVKSLDYDNSYLATSRIQLSFAHANGDGLEASCENTVDAVSDLLGGQKIDGYAAVNMGAISIINNLAGGVTVTIEDDFTESDPSLKIGDTLTLSDEQAVHFVHDRFNVGDETNECRMRRQSMYMSDLKKKLRAKCSADNSYPVKIYESLGDYMVTSLTSSKFSKIAMLVLDEKDQGELHIKGTNSVDDLGFIAFEPDEESLNEVIATLFYKENN